MSFFLSALTKERKKLHVHFQHMRCMHFKRAFPQYCVNGESALLCFKPIMPEFKPAGKDGIALQNTGRMLLAFTPITPGRHGFLWDEQIFFGLSVEEIGMLISHVPHQPLKLSRNLGKDWNNETVTNDGKYDSVSTNESGRKVLSVTPGEYAINFSIDYLEDGMNAQAQIETEKGASFVPMEVAMKAGEWEVTKSILKESIPYLLGWNYMMDIATTTAVNDATKK